MEILNVGKLDSEVLQELVINEIKYKRSEIKTRAGIGEDCAVVDFGDFDCVISTDPITASVNDIGRLAIHISCNDIASNGVEPLGITLAVMLPYGTSKEDVKVIMDQAADAAEACHVEIIGGHTEVTKAVNQPVIVSTAFGKTLSGKSADTREMKPGDKVIMTKKAALEGTGIIVSEHEKDLKNILTDDEIASAKDMLNHVSVITEGIVGGSLGTHGMHDVTEGGIFGAIWEMCNVSKLGALIEEDAIKVSPITVKVCEHYGADWRRMISSGCMLIIAEPDKAESLTDSISAEGIEAIVIGEIKDSDFGIMSVKNGVITSIDPPEADELYKAI